jgi:gliding motility-associated-like protein
MEKLTEIATNISSPLALGGLIAALLFYTLKILLSKNIFPKLTRQFSSQLFLLIVNRFFTLSIIAMLFGFIGFVYTKSIEHNIREQLRIEGIVFIDNNEVSNVGVKILEIERMAVTNDFGKFVVDHIDDQRMKYTLKFSSNQIDTVITINRGDDLRNLVFRFNSKVLKMSPSAASNDTKPAQDQIDNRAALSGPVVQPKKVVETDDKIDMQFEIPETFTPNGDGINDVFAITSPGLRDVTCRIYSRWGQDLFEWQGIHKGWNGVDKQGRAVDDGQYTYVCDIVFVNGTRITRKGVVSLFR